MTYTPALHRAAAAAFAVLAAAPVLAHPGHGSTRTDTVALSVLHLVVEREHVVWIGLAVAALVGLAAWRRWGGR